MLLFTDILILSEPPSIFPFYIERGVELGKRIGIQCLVTKGDAPIKIIWFKDDISLSSLHLPTLTITSVGEFSSSLLIESVAVEHGGRYRCEAHNAAAVATHDIQLSVNGTINAHFKAQHLYALHQTSIISG